MSPLILSFIGYAIIAVCAIAAAIGCCMLAKSQFIIGIVLIALGAVGGYWGNDLRTSIKNGQEQPKNVKTPKERNVLDKLPLFDFSIKREGGRYYDEILSITNKGEGPASNATIIKLPLPDNKQAVAVSGQQKRINEAISKTLLVIGINDPPHFLFRERGYAGKIVRIAVRFRSANDFLFEFIYEGELNKLRLVKRSYSDKGKRIIF
jgi:hypothetical protein